MPIPFLTTNLTAEIGHNTSANAAYNKANFPTNFTGVTWVTNTGTTLAVDSTKMDDSLNPVTPAHVSNVSVKNLIPNWHGLWALHMTNWFGPGSGHTDIGVNTNTDAWVAAAMNDVKARGYDYVILDWYGSGNWTDNVALKIKSFLSANPGFGVKYCIMIDNIYSSTATLQTHADYVQATHFVSADYQTQGGNPILMFWGPPSDHPSVVYATVRSTMGIPMYWMFQGPGSAASAFCDATYDWAHPFSTGVPPGDPYNATDANSYLTSVHSGAKGAMPCISPGFNGYLTANVAWSKGKMMPRDWGKCWLSQAAVVNAKLPTNCIAIQVVTWNDWQEGSSSEGAINNGLTVAPGLVGTNLSWAVSGGTGDETTVDHYRIIATPDGVNVGVIGTVSVGAPKSLDLNTVTGWTGGIPYSVYVIAVGKGSIRNQWNTISFTPSGGIVPPPPIENSQAAIVLPDAPILGGLADSGSVAQWWVSWFKQISSAHPFLSIDTTLGNQAITLPTGAIYLNQERLYLKSSVDANTVTISGAWGGPVILSAQFDKARFRYDGKNWWPV